METRDIHQRFFSFRNGIVAKAFHDAGDPHTRIFGLQLPQIRAIAIESGPDDRLARELWNERDCRESRLLACHLFSPAAVSKEEALAMANDTQTREEADILAWRLLRHLPFAREIAEVLDGYPAEALRRNLEAD